MHVRILLSLAICITCIVGIIAFAANNSEDISIELRINNPIMTVNGEDKEIDPGFGTAPLIINDRTLLPVRAVVEEIGGTVGWNSGTREVTLTYGGDTIVLTIDSATAYLNNEQQTLDTAPVIINDRTMLPIRFITESFGFDVAWDGNEQLVTISKSAEAVQTPSSTEQTASENILIAYFTVPETDDVDAVASASRVVDDGEVVGNVEFIAQTIQEETGGDLFMIETVQQYPGTHQELLEFAAAEMERNDRPELSTHIDNLDDYDVIFLGFPIWNADLPMPMYTFLEEYDLSGKTIIPFTAHGGSGFAGTISTIARLQPEAAVETDGFSVSRNSVSEATDDIITWVQALGYAQAAAININNDNNILIAYFSHTGNTQEVAEYISKQTGGTLFRIEAQEPYTGGTQAVAERAETEEEQNARPAVAAQVENMDQYDAIFIGYPIWYYNAPMVIGTFLESYDLSGKTVIPFCTSASSDIEVSMELINEAAADADIREGLTANGPDSEIDAWLNRVLQ